MHPKLKDIKFGDYIVTKEMGKFKVITPQDWNLKTSGRPVLGMIYGFNDVSKKYQAWESDGFPANALGLFDIVDIESVGSPPSFVNWIHVDEELPEPREYVLVAWGYVDTLLKGDPVIWRYGDGFLLPERDTISFPLGLRWYTNLGCSHSAMKWWARINNPKKID